MKQTADGSHRQNVDVFGRTCVQTAAKLLHAFMCSLRQEQSSGEHRITVFLSTWNMMPTHRSENSGSFS